MKETDLQGWVQMIDLLNRRVEMVPVLPAEHLMHAPGGMEDVCRVVVTVQNLMGCEFTLPNQWTPHFLRS